MLACMAVVPALLADSRRATRRNCCRQPGSLSEKADALAIRTTSAGSVR
jgi:hypothetical protein